MAHACESVSACTHPCLHTWRLPTGSGAFAVFLLSLIVLRKVLSAWSAKPVPGQTGPQQRNPVLEKKEKGKNKVSLTKCKAGWAARELWICLSLSTPVLRSQACSYVQLPMWVMGTPTQALRLEEQVLWTTQAFPHPCPPNPI